MRWLITTILFVAALWAGYWVVASRAQQAALTLWLQDRQQAGWVANYTDLTVKGFPNRLDTVVTDVQLADPNSGWALTAPRFDLLMLSYKPNHAIVVWPETHRLSTPNQTLDFTAQDMRASVVFEPNAGLALDRSTLTLKNVGIVSSQGWTSSIEHAVLATRQTPDTEFGHDIAFDATNFVPANDLKSLLDPAGLLPASFDTFNTKATIVFDAPWDRLAIEGAKPQPRNIILDDLAIQWGDIKLQAGGALTVDNAGLPSGKIAVRAENWQALLALASNAGLIPSEMLGAVETGLGFVAAMSGTKDTLDAPLTFSNGLISLGPIPIGKAPRLILR